MQMYTCFGGRLSQGQNLAGKGRERAPIHSTVVQLQLRHECSLNQRDSGGKVKQELACQRMSLAAIWNHRAHQQLHHLFLGDWICHISSLCVDTLEHMANV